MDDPTYAQGVREIETLRARLRALEAAAAQPRGDLEDAVGAHYSKPPKHGKTRDLESRAKFYSPSEEAGFRQREKDPAAYDAAQRAMGGDLLAQSLALAGREAYIKLGGTIPDPEED